MDKSRVETFSDGVFAIAITLLVLTIAQPTDYAELADQLARRWPSLAAYVVSFLVIGIMWVNHHAIFSRLRLVDRAMFYLNLLLLMTIVFIPYPTEVFRRRAAPGEGCRDRRRLLQRHHDRQRPDVGGGLALRLRRAPAPEPGVSRVTAEDVHAALRWPAPSSMRSPS